MSAPQHPSDTAGSGSAGSGTVVSDPLVTDDAALPDADAVSDDAVVEDTDDEDTDDEEKEQGDDPLVREGDVAGDYLERLLDILDVDGDIDLDVEGDRASVASRAT